MNTPSFLRFDFPRTGIPAEANIRKRYPGEAAAWIWHPKRLNETAFLQFSLDFHLEEEESLTLQVSADQRFQLSVDGVEFAFGPDRSDVEHWSLQTYKGCLQPGHHTFSALVWWIADAAYGVPVMAAEAVPNRTNDSGSDTAVPVPPMAQCSFRGGFLLAAVGALGERINTGTAPWKVKDLTHAVLLEKKDLHTCHAIGPAFVIDAESWSSADLAATPVIVRGPVINTRTGVALPGWKLEPSLLLEQQREFFSGGSIREVRQGTTSLEDWQNLISGKTSIRIGPNQSIIVLWDLENYRCGYPVLKVSEGKGATIGIEWAEALYEANSPTEVGYGTPKGNRNETEGKTFLGFGDHFVCSGRQAFTFPSFWWRSGRFIEISVSTSEATLEIEQLALKTTHYPLECASWYKASEPFLEEIGRLAVSTMKAGAHEVFTDSPYYEQMAYVGDNVIGALVSYIMCQDTRIARRSIELFDWSRSVTGLVAERWPCALYQGSATYAMLWPCMVRNHAWWRNESDFVQQRLRGVRLVVEELAQYRGPTGLLNRLPGWSFVDWVPEWECGCPPAYEQDDSSLIHMHWVHCLQAAADLELHFGDPELYQRLKRMEEAAKNAIVARYWCPENGLLFDDGDHRHLSEHANALASLLGLMPDGREDWWAKLQARSHARCSVYFSHYLMEALYRNHCVTAFFSRLELWRSFLNYGLCTLPEQPEPTRSDCHAWGSHPLYHIYASIAGIRPASPGFRTVRIRPMLGLLQNLEGSLPHPDGEIRFSFRMAEYHCEGFVYLPPSIYGMLEIGAHVQNLVGGENVFCLRHATGECK